MKTNELQQLAAVLGTDSLLADTEAAGTGRVSIAKLAEFLANGDNAVKAALSHKAEKNLADTMVVCRTDDDAERAVVSKYDAMLNNSIQIFDLDMVVTDVRLSSGHWTVLISRTTGDYGVCFAIKYYLQESQILTKTKSAGVWHKWVDVFNPVARQWHSLPLAEGYKAHYTTNRYHKDEKGIVHLVLSIMPVVEEQCENGAIIATLPEGYRPNTPIWYPSYDLFNPSPQLIKFDINTGHIIIDAPDTGGWQRVDAYVTYMAR